MQRRGEKARRTTIHAKKGWLLSPGIRQVTRGEGGLGRSSTDQPKRETIALATRQGVAHDQTVQQTASGVKSELRSRVCRREGGGCPRHTTSAIKMHYENATQTQSLRQVQVLVNTCGVRVFEAGHGKGGLTVVTAAEVAGWTAGKGCRCVVTGADEQPRVLLNLKKEQKRAALAHCACGCAGGAIYKNLARGGALKTWVRPRKDRMTIWWERDSRMWREVIGFMLHVSTRREGGWGGGQGNLLQSVKRS